MRSILPHPETLGVWELDLEEMFVYVFTIIIFVTSTQCYRQAGVSKVN